MMELPLNSSISLADTVAFHQALVHSGASIVEINSVRKHFSAVKGGRLALAAGRARKLSLLVSDVPPAHLDALASGPTLPDTTTIADCRDILTRYALLTRFPASVRRFFASPDLPETPKPSELASPSWKLLDSSDEPARRRANPRCRPRLPHRNRQHLRRLALRPRRRSSPQPPAHPPPRPSPQLPHLHPRGQRPRPPL